jgi:hypothetical protein
MAPKLLNNECTVIAHERSLLLDLAISLGTNGNNFVVGKKLVTKEPLAIVTRDTNREFSDAVNWVVQALFYGEEQGMTKNDGLCQGYSNPTQRVEDLNFLNAVYCVGSYNDILDGNIDNRGLNQINNGTTGMLYAIPYGYVTEESVSGTDADLSGSRIEGIKARGSLNCGVIVPDLFSGDIMNSTGLLGMSFDFCRTLSAALLNGDSDSLNVLTFEENSDGSFIALNDGKLDILAGVRFEQKRDFKGPSTLPGFYSSAPYYYGNETASDDVSFFSVLLPEDDTLFCSFVNLVVQSPVYAEENDIRKRSSQDMPLIELFGGELSWALKDAIAYSGSYDEVYSKNFGFAPRDSRGRNVLNAGGPQVHSLPGLDP